MPSTSSGIRTRARQAPIPKDSRVEKHDRFSARLSTVQKELLQRAADIEGRTLTDFVLAHAQDAAQRTIKEQAILRLSERDSRAFVQALLSPWEPNAELRAEIEEMHALLGAD